MDTKIVAILSEVGKLDADYDIILPGAFDDAINSKMLPPILYMHRRGEIIGQWSNLRMDGKLLKADGVLYTDADGFDLARRAQKLVKTKQLKGVSIGFRPTEWKSVSNKERPYGWDIEKLDLKEASLVDVPANSSAKVTEVKQKFDDKEESVKEDVLIQKYFDAEIEIVEEEDPAAIEAEEKEKELESLAGDITKFVKELKV